MVREAFNNLGVEVEREFGISKWRGDVFDLYVQSVNLLIEIDGNYWHRSKQTIDKAKGRRAVRCGYRFERVSEEVVSGGGLDNWLSLLVTRYNIPVSRPTEIEVQSRENEAQAECSEKWIPVSGYEGFYSVSNLGRIRRDKSGTGRCKAGLIIKLFAAKSHGYQYVNLSREGKSSTHLVHRLVARAFLGDCPPGYEVNHKDGVKTNNALDNLEYVTPVKNYHHAKVLGLRVPQRGEEHSQAVLTAENVRRIKMLLKEGGRSQASIAREFKVHPDTIGRIKRNIGWTHIT